jgi:hypothetical protein
MSIARPAALTLLSSSASAKDAEAQGDRRNALAALRECRASIELLSKLKPHEQLDESLCPNPLQFGQWVEIAAQEFIGCPNSPTSSLTIWRPRSSGSSGTTFHDSAPGRGNAS